MSHREARAVAIVLALLASACTIATRVEPVPGGTLPSLCVEENHAVWSRQFLPALREQLGRHGIVTTIHQKPTPAECPRRLEYDAQWKWDVAVYLRYADIRIYEGGQLVGRATYDARGAFARLDKFGRAEEKVATLVDALLRDVNHAGAATAGSDAGTP